MIENDSISLKQLDEWIRDGKSNRVRQEILRLNIKSINRDDLFAYADIARRVQLPNLIIRWLCPLVRPEKPVYPPANQKETAIYALALSRIGVFKEAILILKGLNSIEQYPQISFYLALVYMEQWDYMSAIIPLKSFIKNKNISNYEKTLALLNLAACYVGTLNWKQAESLFPKLQIEAKNLNAALLLANILELEAQCYILQGKSHLSRKKLEEAQVVIGSDNFQYEFFIRKWKAVLILMEDPQNISPLLKIRSEAIKMRQHETIRECDFYKSFLLRQDDEFLKIYFGSHFPAYKKRILQLYKLNRSLPLKISVILGDTSENSVFEFDHRNIKLTHKTRSLLNLLLSDIYRPFPLSEVFSKIFIDEYFDPFSSKKRVMQLVFNLRKILLQNELPLSISIENGRAFIKPIKKVRISLQRKKEFFDDTTLAYVNTIKSFFKKNYFSSKEVSKLLNVSLRTTRRILQKAENFHWLNRKGYLYQVK